jgi:integrase
MSKSHWEWQQIEPGISIFRRPGRKSWYLNIECKGVLRRYSLRTANEKSARRVAEEKAKDLLFARHGVQVGEIRIIRALAYYVRNRWQKRRRMSTARIRYAIFRDLLNFCDQRKLYVLGEIRTHHLESFIQGRKTSRKLKSVTSNRDVSWIKAFFLWTYRKQYLRVNVADGLEKETVEHQIKYTPTLEDVRAMIDACYSDVIAHLVLFIINTGCRISEALTLTKAKVDLKGGLAILSRSKNHAEKEYRLNPPALAVVKRRFLAAGVSGLIFVSEADTEMDRHNVGRAFREACDAAKVKRFSPHALRRCWLTFIRPLVGDSAALDLGGWSSSAMMKYYDAGRGKMESPVVLDTA